MKLFRLKVKFIFLLFRPVSIFFVPLLLVSFRFDFVCVVSICFVPICFCLVHTLQGPYVRTEMSFYI